MKPENRLIGSVHILIPKQIHIEKMNNPYRRGTADCWYSTVPYDMWIEWKWVKEFPKRDATLIKPAFEPLQEAWCTARFNEGRRVRVVVGSTTGCVVFTDPAMWREGIPRGEAQVLSKQQIADWIQRTCGLEPSPQQPTVRSRSTA